MTKREIVKALEVARKREDARFWFQLEIKSLVYWSGAPIRKFNLQSGFGKFERKEKW